MSAVLKKITRALDTTIKAFEDAQEASGVAMDTKLFQSAHVLIAQANNGIDEMAENYRRAAQQEERLNQQAQGLNQSIREGTSTAGQLLGKITSMVAAYASLSTIKNIVQESLEAADIQIDA